MNLKSGKFGEYERGKLVALARVHFAILSIDKISNLQRFKFSYLEIENAGALQIDSCDHRQVYLPRGQAGNWSRLKFFAPKIETVGNGSIRQ